MIYRTVITRTFRRPRSSIAERFWSKVRKTEGCWEWAAGRITDPRGKSGYGNFYIGAKDGKKIEAVAHRVAWELTNGAIPEGLKVLHECDNPGCVRPDHLFLGTQKDNIADMISKGRRADFSGIRNGRSKLRQACQP